MSPGVCGGRGGWPIPNNITVAPSGWRVYPGIQHSMHAGPRVRSDSAPMRPAPGHCRMGGSAKQYVGQTICRPTCSVCRCGVEARGSRFRRSAKAEARPAMGIPIRPMANRQCTRAGVLCECMWTCVRMCVSACVCACACERLPLPSAASFA